MNLTLADLNINQLAVITGYATQTPYRAKMLALGLTKGAIVFLVRRAPTGDPLEVRVKQGSITLRKDEARTLLVKLHINTEIGPNE